MFQRGADPLVPKAVGAGRRIEASGCDPQQGCGKGYHGYHERDAGKTLRWRHSLFSYSTEIAREYIKMGYYIGVGGVVTFNNGRKLKEVVEAIPLTSIVLETDSPYLSPVPFRGKRNSALNIPYVAKRSQH